MNNYQKYRKWCEINRLDEVKAQNMQYFNFYLKKLEAVGKMPIFTSNGVVLLNKANNCKNFEPKIQLLVKVTKQTMNGATWLEKHARCK